MEEKYTVIGIEHRSYVSKKTGKNVEGYNLYLTQEVDDKNVLGVRCYSEWISPEITPTKSRSAVRSRWAITASAVSLALPSSDGLASGHRSSSCKGFGRGCAGGRKCTSQA